MPSVTAQAKSGRKQVPHYARNDNQKNKCKCNRFATPFRELKRLHPKRSTNVCAAPWVRALSWGMSLLQGWVSYYLGTVFSRWPPNS